MPEHAQEGGSSELSGRDEEGEAAGLRCSWEAWGERGRPRPARLEREVTQREGMQCGSPTEASVPFPVALAQAPSTPLSCDVGMLVSSGLAVLG